MVPAACTAVFPPQPLGYQESWKVGKLSLIYVSNELVVYVVGSPTTMGGYESIIVASPLRTFHTIR